MPGPIRRFGLCALALLGCAHLAFAKPYLFNATESATPGDVIYLQGDNFVVSGSNPTVWFHLVNGTESTLAPDVQLDRAAVTTVSNQAITVNLPANIPMGLYAVWVKDSSGVLNDTPAMINQARATSFEYGEVPASYTFRIFGRNLCFPGKTPVVKMINGGATYAATVSGAYPNDGNILQVTAPANLPTSGTCTVTVSNGYGSGAGNFDVVTAEKTILARAGGTDVFNLGVPWGADFASIVNSGTTIVVNPSGDTSGTTDLRNIRSALNIARSNTNGGVVTLVTGTYTLNKGTDVTGIDIPGKVVLKGAGIDQTVINDISPAISSYSHFITMSGTTPFNGTLSGVQGFTCNQLMTTGTTGTTGTNGTTSVVYLLPPDIRNYAGNSSEMFFDRLKINFAHGLFNSGTNVIYGAFIPQSSNDTKVLVQNCTMNYFRFGNNNYYSYGYTYGSDYLFRNNTFSQFHCRLEFLFINNLLIEGNHFTRDGTFPPANWGGANNCGGIEASGADNKILNNTLDAINLPLPYYNDGETILCQNGPVYANPTGTTDQGTLTSATSSLLYDTTKNWTTDAYKNELVWITSGPSQGAWAVITGNTTTRLTLDRKWVTSATSGNYAILPADSYVLSTVTGATFTTVTDATQNWPTDFHKGDSVAIVNGPGMGQVRTIVSNTLNMLTVSPAWDEPPTTSSKYSINGALSYGAQRWLVKGNTLHDVPRGIIYYLGGYDCVTVNNRLTSAGGILLVGFQRNWLTSGTVTNSYQRMDIGWNNLVADNVVTNPDTTGSASRAAYYATHVGLTPNSPLFGTILLGVENRRNILQSTIPNLVDTAFACRETYANIIYQQQTTGNAYTGVPAILGTIFSDNLSISSSNAYEFTTACWQTTLWNSLMLSCTNTYSDTALAGGTQASLNTILGGDSCFLRANFSGTGTSTGGASDLVNTGATGTLIAGTGQSSIAVSSTNPFISGSGGSISYLTVTTGTTGSGAQVQFTSATARTSWGRIFDGRMLPSPTNGKWQVNGGFDFFWRPTQTPSAANSMRPIDITNNGSGNGLLLTFANLNATILKHEILTGANGGGGTVTGTYGSGFAARQIYHVGVTYATNAITGVTTAKIFAASGTGAILTSGSNAAAPIGTGTFTLNPTVVTNTSGFLSGTGTWNFGDGSYPNGTIRTNDYDSLRLYSQDPGAFPALGSAPLTLVTQPASQAGATGQAITFSVIVSGTGPFFYQWTKNGVKLSGAISSSLVIPSLTANDAGNYSVVVTNAFGSVTSTTASLTVSTPIPTSMRWGWLALPGLLMLGIGRCLWNKSRWG